MARIAGINIPKNKHVSIGLTSIFGVGRNQPLRVCEAAGVKFETKVKDLTEAEVTALRSAIAKLPVEGDLRREVSMNIKRLMDLGSYRGMRHRKGLPMDAICRSAASGRAPMRARARARARRPSS